MAINTIPPLKPGARYGRFTILEGPEIRILKSRDKPKGIRAVKARCECGTVKYVRLYSLVYGHDISCGCKRAKTAATLNKLRACRCMCEGIEDFLRALSYKYTYTDNVCTICGRLIELKEASSAEEDQAAVMRRTGTLI